MKNITVPNDMTAETKHTTASGLEFEILKYTTGVDVLIKFTKSGYITKTKASCIRSGLIKDRYNPSVYDVGFVGEGDYKPTNKGKQTKEYILWSNMLKRCYDPLTQERQPTYKGCTVESRWHNFQNFAEDIKNLPGYIQWVESLSPKNETWELDKDTLVEGNKVYSRYTCQFLSKQDNKEATAKLYTFIDSNGEIREIYNLSAFCKIYGLDITAMCLLHMGKRKNHKGWTKHA